MSNLTMIIYFYYTGIYHGASNEIAKAYAEGFHG